MTLVPVWALLQVPALSPSLRAAGVRPIAFKDQWRVSGAPAAGHYDFVRKTSAANCWQQFGNIAIAHRLTPGARRWVLSREMRFGV